MHVRLLIAALPLATALIGCQTAGPVVPRQIYSLPVSGQFSNGEAAAGEAAAYTDGRGVFWVQAPGGLRCEGNFDPRSRSATFVVPVACGRGVTGEAVITRQLDGWSGSGIAKLSNGLRAQFVFGNITFGQAFGGGGMAMSR